MKKLHTLAAFVVLAAVAAGQAMAADVAAPAAPVASAATRAEVKAEVAKARADGTLRQTSNQDIQAVKPKESTLHAKRAANKAKAKADAASAAETAAK